ncbi:MAG TPA: flagellar biosynthesis protein FlhA [Syntrophorhabdus sp.]|jgi:flagellar biosynthesis protein FlhA|nr:flagellar biosynthesis protein FlhA [Syntrophorhabdus sp.]OPX94427.1 MAG: Flagellar biosynthesis protein FlhA [Syntrophorhabdus sp. PtaB.Bin027]OQB78002.1 MAG: Flagellar biosynthesis protein FlhA [Deltaproteobacteria bacterium ADurb.Bin135]HNQ45445.1 flagellar biosynthesis protein FlhA [Syntrophorhabdus sp.]HNS77155.1 flagellar biosynthesis protein FlhA [Syntrophorhabdus sp.]
MGRFGSGIKEKSDIFVAVSVVFVILIMIVPLNAFFMDIFLTLSISLSILILFIGMYINKPLDFSVFPSVLLIVTLFRLSLNIATTRLVLVHGDEGAHAAGYIIKGFGTFIVGGNYVVGAVVFFILTIINFVVITKGAGRVAEVAARFTLDAMPGKQMSIDADLNAGLIDDAGARKRRESVEMEADFYGAMDGASKFVRGDAIAGIIIIFVNIIGGLVIGIVQKGMSFNDALTVYTILTIGDGLVSQIPALLTSTAAGIIVTRAASETNLGSAMITQLFTQPRAMLLASIVILCIGFVPGIPLVPFLVLSSCTFGTSYLVGKTKKEEIVSVPEVTGEERDKGEFIQPMEILEIEIGYGLIPIVDAEQSGELLDKIRAIRKQMAIELGIVVPPMKLRDNLQLKAGEYLILLKGIEMGRGELMAGYVLTMGHEDKKKTIDGIPTKEPVFNLDAYWIKEKDRDQYVAAGMTVVDHPTIIATHLTEIIRNNAHELMTRQETQKLIDTVSATHSKVIEEIAQNQINAGIIQKVLQSLLREQVSIRDLITILEAVADASSTSREPELITEFVRQRMARSILKPYLIDGTLNLLILEKNLEEKLINSLQPSDQGTYLALDLAFSQQLIEKVGNEAKKAMLQNIQPVILVHPVLRSKLRRFLERYIQGITVISHNEIPPQIKIQSLGVIKVNES